MAIEVEPSHSADVRIRCRENRQEHVFAIEFKAGAKLQDHQNPSHKRFEDPDGYGQKLLETPGAGLTYHYIVLGLSGKLNLPATHPTLKIALVEHQWRAIDPGKESSSLVGDLLDSLGELGIGGFRMRTVDSITIKTGIQHVGAAWEVLQAVKEHLGFVEKRCEWDAGRVDKGSCCIGVSVEKLPASQHLKSEVQQQLGTLANVTSERVAWYGYISDTSNRVQAEVWLYCRPELVRSLEKAMRSRFENRTRRDRDVEMECVVIQRADSEQLEDAEWFCSVLRAFASLAKPLNRSTSKR